MRKKQLHRLSQEGFTLLEALITGAVAMVVIMGYLAMNSYFTNQQKALEVRSNAQDFNKRMETAVYLKATELLKKAPTTPNEAPGGKANK